MRDVDSKLAEIRTAADRRTARDRQNPAHIYDLFEIEDKIYTEMTNLYIMWGI